MSNIGNDHLNDDLIWVTPEVYERIKNHPDGIYVEAQGEPLLKLKVVGWETEADPVIVEKKTCKYYKPYMDTLKLICEQFYNIENCGAGGPLHILLDDDNIDTDDIHWCINCCIHHLIDDDGYPPYVNILGIMIANEYAKMSIEERVIFDEYLNGRKLDCCGNCEECELLGEIYDYMEEAESNSCYET